MDYPLNEQELSETHPDFGSDAKMTRDVSADRADNDGLIVPRKLPNPCINSKDRQNLHRELLFNQKIGKNVLNQKTELQRVMENRKEKKTIKELEQKKLESKTPFERMIEERYKRLETEKTGDPESLQESRLEFLDVRAKIKAKTDTK